MLERLRCEERTSQGQLTMGALWRSDSAPPAREHKVATAVPRKPRPGKHRVRWVVGSTLLLGLMGATGLAVFELRTAHFQSTELSRYAATLSYEVKDGPSDAIVYPGNGPFDQRQGYSRLPTFIERLQGRGFEVLQQARFSTALSDLSLIHI